MKRANNRINLTRDSRVRFWALVIARAGYANHWTKEAMKNTGQAGKPTGENET